MGTNGFELTEKDPENRKFSLFVLQIQDCAKKKGTVAFFSKLLAIASVGASGRLPI
jgi:hypothetical protein